VSSGRIDPNLLAAFLENRLTAEERRDVIEQLNRSAEDYDAFADAASLLAELDDDANVAATPAVAPATPPVPAAPPAALRTRWWPRTWMLLPIAAAVAAVVLVPPLLLRGPASFSDMLALAAPAELVQTEGANALATSLGSDWSRTGWSVSRGGDDAGGTRAREFRIGVRSVDLHLARDRGDDGAAAEIAGELGALLEQVPGGASAAAQVAAVRDAPQQSQAALDAVDALLGESAWVRLGAWAEHARLAARTEHLDHFDDDAMRALRGLRVDVRDVAAEIDAVESAAAARDADALRTSITALMQAAGD